MHLGHEHTQTSAQMGPSDSSPTLINIVQSSFNTTYLGSPVNSMLALMIDLVRTWNYFISDWGLGISAGNEGFEHNNRMNVLCSRRLFHTFQRGYAEGIEDLPPQKISHVHSRCRDNFVQDRK
jgi:hypothetical protein